MMNGSTCRWILWSTRLAGLNPYSWSAGFTSQAMRHFWSLASNLVIGPAPLFEARMFFQLVSTSPPSGVTSPRPVTTTRRIGYSLEKGKTAPRPWTGEPFQIDRLEPGRARRVLEYQALLASI